jgi:hypothetical protein
VPLAVLSSAYIDATQVDPATIQLAGAGVAQRGNSGNYLADQKDVNGDGLLDLVLKVQTEDLDPDAIQDGLAILTGSTFGGIPIKGSDYIIVYDKVK